jgi:2-hydroxy-3-oxopropionate reductase
VNATLSIMVGGDEETFNRCLPLFQVMGKNIVLVGDSGAGQVCKACNQIVVGLTIEAVGEALVLAKKAGVDPAKVRQALMGGFASSRILEVHAERMLNGTFNPGFKIKLHQKDLNLALSSAKALSLSLPNTAIAQQMFSSCIAHGGAEQDHSALVLAIEGLAAHSIRGAK